MTCDASCKRLVLKLSLNIQKLLDKIPISHTSDTAMRRLNENYHSSKMKRIRKWNTVEKREAGPPVS